MKKIVQNVLLCSAAVAVVLASGTSAKAATTNQILTALGTAGYSTSKVADAIEKQSFIGTGAAIKLQILESTKNNVFGFEKGGVNSYLSAQRQWNNAGTGFDAFSKGGSSIAAMSTASLATFQPVALVAFTNNASDYALPDNANSADATAAIGLGKFNLVLKNDAFFDSNNDGKSTINMKSTSGIILNSSANLASQYSYDLYKVSGNGIAPDSYLVSYQLNNGAVNGGFTFVALISGVVNPEPASIAMLGTGVLGLAGFWARRRRSVVEATMAV